jgi:hypothetical protein
MCAGAEVVRILKRPTEPTPTGDTRERALRIPPRTFPCEPIGGLERGSRGFPYVPGPLHSDELALLGTNWRPLVSEASGPWSKVRE